MPLDLSTSGPMLHNIGSPTKLLVSLNIYSSYAITYYCGLSKRRIIIANWLQSYHPCIFPINQWFFCHSFFITTFQYKLIRFSIYLIKLLLSDLLLLFFLPMANLNVFFFLWKPDDIAFCFSIIFVKIN